MCFAAAIIVSISTTIILSLSLSVLAYDHMQLAFANQQTTMIKNQFNNSIPTNSSSNSTTPKIVF
jgi:hypothetical protein